MQKTKKIPLLSGLLDAALIFVAALILARLVGKMPPELVNYNRGTLIGVAVSLGIFTGWRGLVHSNGLLAGHRGWLRPLIEGFLAGVFVFSFVQTVGIVIEVVAAGPPWPSLGHAVNGGWEGHLLWMLRGNILIGALGAVVGLVLSGVNRLLIQWWTASRGRLSHTATGAVQQRLETFLCGMKRLWDWILESELRIASVALVLAALIVGYLSLGLYESQPFREGVLVEAHGMVLDIAVIGVFILWLNLLRDKKDRVRRYREEIEDYREWKSDEAAHRIAGNIKRLNLLGVHSIPLSRCYLRGTDLRGAVLRGSPMHWVDLGGARLRHADLSGADLDTAFLGDADLRATNLRTANLKRARLRNARANGASFAGGNLAKADLKHARCRGAVLSGCNLTDVCFIGTDLSGADMRNCTGLTAEALSHAKNLAYCLMDDDIRDQVKAISPNLFKSYKGPLDLEVAGSVRSAAQEFQPDASKAAAEGMGESVGAQLKIGAFEVASPITCQQSASDGQAVAP